MFVSWLKIETDWKMQINVFHCDTYLNMFSHPALFLSLSGRQVLSIACVMLPIIWCNGHTFSFMRLWISLCGSHRPFCLFLHISIGIIHIPGSVLIFFLLLICIDLLKILLRVECCQVTVYLKHHIIVIKHINFHLCIMDVFDWQRLRWPQIPCL